MNRHATAVAYLALFVALGGTGYAATQLAPNSVGSPQIRNGSVQNRDLARGVLSRTNAKLASTITDVVTDPATGVNLHITAADGKDGAAGPMGPVGPQGDSSQVAGPQGDPGTKGDKGDTGAQGVPGSALGFGRVYYNAGDGTTTLTDNGGITVTRHGLGSYCVNITNTSATSHVAMANVEGEGYSSRNVAVLANPSGVACNGSDFEVTTYDGSSNSVDFPFYVSVY